MKEMPELLDAPCVRCVASRTFNVLHQSTYVLKVGVAHRTAKSVVIVPAVRVVLGLEALECPRIDVISIYSS